MDQWLEVLIVGAGPTGLTLAAQLDAFGARFRIIDRLRDRSRESRALAVQARTLEVFQTLGLGETLVARDSTSTRLVLNIDGRVQGPLLDCSSVQQLVFESSANGGSRSALLSACEELARLGCPGASNLRSMIESTEDQEK